MSSDGFVRKSVSWVGPVAFSLWSPHALASPFRHIHGNPPANESAQ